MEQNVYLSNFPADLGILSNDRSCNDLQAFLVVAVISAPRNAERRRAIRETWLNLERHLRTEVIHFFVVGRKGLHSEILESLEAESAENKDVLLLPNVEDSFDQLTAKVLATFVQLHKSVDFRYLLKVYQTENASIYSSQNWTQKQAQ